MKSGTEYGGIVGQMLVAPLAGAWIEIIRPGCPAGYLLSLPSRERGLKSGIGNRWNDSIQVAPLAGAWIEIKLRGIRATDGTVAPLAGAWIEINISCVENGTYDVAPLAGAWIEIQSMTKDGYST